MVAHYSAGALDAERTVAESPLVGLASESICTARGASTTEVMLARRNWTDTPAMVAHYSGRAADQLKGRERPSESICIPIS